MGLSGPSDAALGGRCHIDHVPVVHPIQAQRAIDRPRILLLSPAWRRAPVSTNLSMDAAWLAASCCYLGGLAPAGDLTPNRGRIFSANQSRSGLGRFLLLSDMVAGAPVIVGR